MSERSLVVAAAILAPGGDRVLAARRTAPPDAAGRWELPGGKVEPGESPEAALVREIGEELGCLVELLDWLPAESPIGETHLLRAATVRLTAGEPAPREQHGGHDAIRWLAAEELDEVDWLEPDRPFLPHLRAALAPSTPGGVRGIFFDEDDAEAVLARLRADGWEARLTRERYHGEDDDEDHPWAVTTDAPELVLEVLVDEYDGWLDAPQDDPGVAPEPLGLPTGPRRIKRPRPRICRVTTPDQRILFVHAHPDDESIGNGATMAKYVAEGRGVTVVTCTAGEMGEILVPELEHLAADKEDRLGEHRRGEIADAMKALGVTDHRWLGGFGTYRDSGMQWHADGYAIPADTISDNAFWRADLTEAADHLVAVIRELRPQVLVTYDQFGNYGHPDHIQAHRVAMYAAQLAAVPSYKKDLGEPWEVAKIYWTAMSESRMREGLRRLRAAGEQTFFDGVDPDGPLPMTTPDEDLAAVVDATEYVEQKMDALRAYPTQISVDGPFFALSNNLGNAVWGVEHYRIAKGSLGPRGEDGLETDLFAGL